LNTLERLNAPPDWTLEDYDGNTLASLYGNLIAGEAIWYARGFNDATYGPPIFQAVRTSDGAKFTVEV